MKYFFACFYILITSNSFANEIDSLIAVSQKNKNNTYYKFALKRAAQLQNNDFVNCTRLCKYLIGELSLSNQTDLLAEALLLNGLTHYFAGNYDSSIHNYLQAIHFFGKKNNYSGIAKVHNEMGFFYRKQKNDTACLQSFENAYQYAMKANDISATATAINNIGVYNQDKLMHEEALIHFASAQKMYRSLGDSIGVSYTMDYSAVSYAFLKQYDKALQLESNAYELRIAYKDSNAAALSLINMAEFSTQMNNSKAAIQYLTNCIEICNRIHYKELLSASFKMLAEIYEKMGNSDKALTYFKEYQLLHESLFNEKSNKHIQLLNTQYETDKRLQQIQILSQENLLQKNEKRNLRNIFIGIVSALLLIMFSLYLYLKSKKQRAIDEALIKEKENRNRAIIEAEEKERVRIARELHDGVAQSITATKMQLEYFAENIPKEYKTDLFENILDLVSNTATEVRMVSHSMIPNALLKSGLLAAVRDFVNRTGNDKFKINLTTLGLQERLNAIFENILFRILQELVNNILKHAQATEVTIQLIKDEDNFTLMVEDNGIGFDVDKVMKIESVGMSNLQSRVQFLHGSIHFDSSIGRGTTVIAEFDLSHIAEMNSL